MKLVTNKDDIHIIAAKAVSNMISRFEECRENNIYKLPKQQLTKFHSWKVPKIGLNEYLERIHKYAKCSPSCYVIALIYIDRAIQCNNNFFLTKFNAHRYFSIATLGSSLPAWYWL